MEEILLGAVIQRLDWILQMIQREGLHGRVKQRRDIFGLAYRPPPAIFVLSGDTQRVALLALRSDL